MSTLEDLRSKFGALAAYVVAAAGNPVPPFFASDTGKLNNRAQAALATQDHIDGLIQKGNAIPQPHIGSCEDAINVALASMATISKGMPGTLSPASSSRRSTTPTNWA